MTASLLAERTGEFSGSTVVAQIAVLPEPEVRE